MSIVASIETYPKYDINGIKLYKLTEWITKCIRNYEMCKTLNQLTLAKLPRFLIAVIEI